MPVKVSTEDLQKALDLVTRYGSAYRASLNSDIPQTTIGTRAQIARRKGLEPTVEPEPVEVAGTSTLYDGDGKVKLRWVKEKEQKAHEKIMAMVDELKQDLPKIKPTKKPKQAADHLMTVIPWGDPHFGMYAWKDEVGNDFDLDIASRDLCGAVSYLLDQSPSSGKCLIANLGDFFHADNNQGMTTKGTRLDFDTRIAKVIQVGVRAIRKAIETALTKHKEVLMINAIGNHDETLSMALSIMLAHIYENEERVTVFDQPTPRHYVRFGKVLIGVTHGHRVKQQNLPGVMATERAEDWGQTKYRYFLTGHLHHDAKKEFNGCVTEQFRTMAPGDSYSVGGGWLSGQDMKAIVMHSEYGEVGRTTCSINLLRDHVQNS